MTRSRPGGRPRPALRPALRPGDGRTAPLAKGHGKGGLAAPVVQPSSAVHMLPPVQPPSTGTPMVGWVEDEE